MGLIWKLMRSGRAPEHVLALQEPQGTLSRKWRGFWRLGQYWCLIKVATESARQPYYICRCIEGGRSARYHFLIHTPYVLVQVGPEKTYFWAETRTRESLPLTATGVKKPSILVRQKYKGTAKALNTYHHTKA
jgi:hypothetical protein